MHHLLRASNKCPFRLLVGCKEKSKVRGPTGIEVLDNCGRTFNWLIGAIRGGGWGALAGCFPLTSCSVPTKPREMFQVPCRGRRQCTFTTAEAAIGWGSPISTMPFTVHSKNFGLSPNPGLRQQRQDYFQLGSNVSELRS